MTTDDAEDLVAFLRYRHPDQPPARARSRGQGVEWLGTLYDAVS